MLFLSHSPVPQPASPILRRPTAPSFSLGQFLYLELLVYKLRRFSTRVILYCDVNGRTSQQNRITVNTSRIATVRNKEAAEITSYSRTHTQAPEGKREAALARYQRLYQSTYTPDAEGEDEIG